MNIIVLGGGLVGGPIAADLSNNPDYKVTIADINDSAGNKIKKFNHAKEITFLRKDLSNCHELKSLLSPFDLVVNAVPGFMGFNTLKTIIEAGKDVVDIAFFPEDPFLLNDLAKKMDVTAIIDCGVAPGMSNILTSYADSCMEKTESAVIYVGGLPEIREWPYEYKAGFSPIDVIEEYTRPAYYVEKGEIICKPALSDPEYINFPKIGTLEAFNTDGLRTLIKTLSIPDMKEKTLRYPGHIEKMKILRETGFFGTEKVQINDTEIRPIDLTAKLLFPKWELKPGESDITIMRIKVCGIKDGKKISYTYELFDKYDSDTGIHSMARTTGYTAAAVLNLLGKGMFAEKGIIAPEQIGKDKNCVEFILNYLKTRGVEYEEIIKEI